MSDDVDQVRYESWLNLGAVAWVLGGLAIAMIAIAATFASDSRPDFGEAVVALVVALVGIIPAVIGFGLIRRYEWAFYPACALAVVSLILFPFGTILGIGMITGLLRSRRQFAPVDSADEQDSGSTRHLW